MMTLCRVDRRRPAPGLGRTWFGNGATAFEAQLCHAVTRWSCDAFHQRILHIFVWSNYVLPSFNIINILGCYMTMIIELILWFEIIFICCFRFNMSSCHRHRVDAWHFRRVFFRIRVVMHISQGPSLEQTWRCNGSRGHVSTSDAQWSSGLGMDLKTTLAENKEDGPTTRDSDGLGWTPSSHCYSQIHCSSHRRKYMCKYKYIYNMLFYVTYY